MELTLIGEFDGDGHVFKLYRATLTPGIANIYHVLEIVGTVEVRVDLSNRDLSALRNLLTAA